MYADLRNLFSILYSRDFHHRLVSGRDENSLRTTSGIKGDEAILNESDIAFETNQCVKQYEVVTETKAISNSFAGEESPVVRGAGLVRRHTEQVCKRPISRRRPGLGSMLHLFTILIVYYLLVIEHVAGGICWASMERNGKCKELAAEKVDKEGCCAIGQGPGNAWSSDDLDPGTLFFWRVLGGGVPCTGCRESCSGVTCGAGRRCALRMGRPRCVCAPRCGGGRAGPVCGTDGRSYRSLCRLRKRACRRRARDLTLDYYGHCQNSCARIRCGNGRHCLVDQDSRAHCVRCARTCPRAQHGGGTDPAHDGHEVRALCGADGITYPSACHLRAAACRKGRSIPLAYRGPCSRSATCGSIRCRERQACLVDELTHTPRCVTCDARCPRARRTLCATNNHTYASWCHMLRDACATGYVIETKHAGKCGAVDLDELNTVSNEEEEVDETS